MRGRKRLRTFGAARDFALAVLECQAARMRWDDLQLLKLMDELEESQQTSYLVNGIGLLQRASEGKPVD